jgi:hypothetical protein
VDYNISFVERKVNNRKSSQVAKSFSLKRVIRYIISPRSTDYVFLLNPGR